MIRTPLSAEDAAERAQFLSLFGRLLIFGFPILVMGEAAGVAFGWYGGGVFLLLLVLNLPFLWFFAGWMYHMMDRGAVAFTHTVLGAGNLKPDPAHSPFETLAIRGHYREAAEAYRAHLVTHPEDNLARVKLAELHRTNLNEPDLAEQLYLEVRRTTPTPREEFLVANLLIEHYRATGQRGRLMAELARFASRYAGTRAGRDAARALKDLKAELASGEGTGGDG